MTIRVGPDVEEATHHLKLVKADTTERGLILCDSQGKPDPRGIRRVPTRGSTVVSKPAQGRYDDRQHPYVAIEQNDWSGGRGEWDFERNKTKFYDSHCVMSALAGRLMPAPAPHWQPGIGNFEMNLPSQGNSSIRWWGSVSGIDQGHGVARQNAGYRYLSYKFVADSSFTPDYAMIVARPVWDTSTPANPGNLRVSVYTHDAGNDEPDALITGWTANVAATDWPEEQWGVDNYPDYSIFLKLKWASGPSLTASSTYWLVIDAPIADDPAEWEIGCSSAANTDVRLSTDASTWVSSIYTSAPFFALFYDTTSVGVKRYMFEYKRGLYHVEARDDASSPSFYLHGFRGVVDSNTTTQITDAAGLTSAANDELINGAIHFVGGTGKGQERRVTDNTNSTVTFTPRIQASLSTDTEWVYLGSGTKASWQKITGLSPAISNPTGQPLVVNDVVYFPFGDSTNMVRYNEYNNSGTWTRRTATDGTNKAVLLTKHHKDDGSIVIVRAQNSDANGDVSISLAPVQDWGTDLTFEDPIRIGDNASDIKGILSHDGYIWVVKEDGLWAVSNNIPDIVLDDMKHIRSDYTGVANISKTPYMYFSAGAGLEEFYGKVMQDMGPNRDAGLPPWKQGHVSALSANAKFLFLAMDNVQILDADQEYVSTVHMYNGQGWHEIFRAPTGERVRSLFFQVPHPAYQSYLWIGMDRFTCCLPFPMYQFDPFLDPKMDYHWDGHVDSGWRSDNLIDIDKHWALVTLFQEHDPQVSSSGTYGGWWYETRVAGDTFWTSNATLFNTDPSEQQSVQGTYTTGKRIRDRLRYDLRQNGSMSMRLRSLVLDYVGRYPTGWTYEIKFLLSEQDDEPMEDLQGDTGDYTAGQIFSFLEAAKDDPLPLTMTSTVEEFNNKTVLVNPMSLSVREVTEGESRMLIATCMLVETQV